MIVRHDDMDFRMETKDYIAVHELFIAAKQVETAVLQFSQFDHFANIQPSLIEYMNKTPYWDFQIHGWQHEEYDKFPTSFILRDMYACKYFIKQLFHKEPTIWFPPWNRRNETMETAAAMVGLEISNESNDIQKFIREVKAGTFNGTTLYFHAWNHNEREAIPEMLEKVKIYESW